MKKPIPSVMLYLVLSASIIFLISLSGCGKPDGNPADGKRWYEMHNCSSCHGSQGNDGRGPEIAGIDMRFGSFVKKLRTGGASIMPEYPEEKIPKQDAADIYLYLKSLKE